MAGGDATSGACVGLALPDISKGDVDAKEACIGDKEDTFSFGHCDVVVVVVVTDDCDGRLSGVRKVC